MAQDSNGIPESPINATVPEIADMQKEISGTTAGEKTKTITQESGYLTNQTFDYKQLLSDYTSLTGNTAYFDDDGITDEAVWAIGACNGDWQNALDFEYSNYLHYMKTDPQTSSDAMDSYIVILQLSDIMSAVMQKKYGNGEYAQQVRDAFNGL